MLEFKEETHEYFKNGKKIPCVSEIISFISQKVYQDIEEETLDRASVKGLKVHRAIEDLEKYGDYSLELEYEDYMLSYKKFKKLEDVKILKQEQVLATDEFGGTYDIYAKLNGKLVLIDIKTTSKIHNILLKLQLAGYDELCEFNNIPVEEHYVLQLTKNNYKLKKIKINKEIFDLCKKLYFYWEENNG